MQISDLITILTVYSTLLCIPLSRQTSWITQFLYYRSTHKNAK